MTRADLRIAAAKKALAKAENRLKAADDAANAAVRKVRDRHRPRILAADRAITEARAAVTRAELAAHGIVPGKTIIVCRPAWGHYQGRYVVEVGPEGWPRLWPVGKTGKVLADRNYRQSPWRWSDARVTGEEAR